MSPGRYATVEAGTGERTGIRRRLATVSVAGLVALCACSSAFLRGSVGYDAGTLGVSGVETGVGGQLEAIGYLGSGGTGYGFRRNGARAESFDREREAGMVEEIRELYEYNRWANHRVLEAASGLTAEEFARDLRSSFPSVRDTLVHILGAEWIWLSRWQGTSPSGLPDSWDLSTLEAIRAHWSEVEREQMAFIAGLDEESLGRIAAYRNMKGEAFASPLWPMLRHVVNHSTYHRGQVTTLLRQLGAETVGTDLIAFYRERARPQQVRAGG